jgi:hypothetical protein
VDHGSRQRYICRARFGVAMVLAAAGGDDSQDEEKEEYGMNITFLFYFCVYQFGNTPCSNAPGSYREKELARCLVSSLVHQEHSDPQYS